MVRSNPPSSTPSAISRPSCVVALARGLNGFELLVSHGDNLLACWHPDADPVLAQSRFLLKYTSRDEVELLGRGNGGVVEVRNAVAEYEEKSPLYGFLRYRRRNVIIKYLPDDCSRLVQGLFQTPSTM